MNPDQKDIHDSEKEVQNCVFCGIVAGTVPSYKLYEDDETIAFLDIQPNHPGHTLVVPKTHVENIYGMSDEIACRVAMTVRKLAVAVKNATNADGINIISNNESAAGQVVMHAHTHIIPRFNEDGFKMWPHEVLQQTDAVNLIDKITKELA